MPEHYTKNTVSCTVWCNRCNKATEHRVDNGRRGPCMQCLKRLEAESASRKVKVPPAVQETLFNKTFLGDGDE
jgi:hypothetical protein